MTLLRDILRVCGFAPHDTEAEFDVASIEARLARLQRMLSGALAFWKGAVDHTHGGFHGLIDLRGCPVPGAPKDLVQQVRHLWTFSQVHRFVEPSQSVAAVCDRQFRFLRDSLYHRAESWFHPKAESTGEPIPGHVHLYPISFCLLGLSNFAMAFSDEPTGSEALEMVNGVFEKMVRESWDFENGFDEAKYQGHWCKDDKEINTQMHLLEGVAELYEANRYLQHPAESLVRQVLERQLALVTEKAIVNKAGETFCSRGYKKDWSLVDDREVDFGHDIEVVYLVWHAASRLELEESRAVTEPVLALAESTARRAFDPRLGRWYYSGEPLTGKPRIKIANFWTHFEALNGLMIAFRLSRNPDYLVMFDRILEWLDTKQRHVGLGEWYYNVNWRGRPLKRGCFGEDCAWISFEWKSSYHALRALIACTTWLESELGEAGFKS